MRSKTSTIRSTSKGSGSSRGKAKGLRAIEHTRKPKRELALEIVVVSSPKHLEQIRELFTEYADSLEIDLCFQNFREELVGLPGAYGPPSGRLFLAGRRTAAGCVAIRPIDEGICEMKRLYVRPEFRRTGLGRRLAQASIATARELGFKTMRLDTLASMKPAIALYHSLGFRKIAPYYHNPNSCAVFMELALSSKT